MHRSHEPEQVTAFPISTEISDDHDPLIRQFIRHPSSVPLEFEVIECGRAHGDSKVINVSRGGLCFLSDVPLPKGARIHLSIPIETPPFEITGHVTWCKIDNNHFCIGIAFDSTSAAYSVRMVEQVCYIEHYRQWILDSEGRVLTSEQAAKEWIEHYAADFPKH